MWLRTPLAILYPIASMVALFPAAGPITDIDSYWHVVIGDEIRSTGQVTGTGDSWAWFDPESPWTTSQWLSEVAMSWLVENFGWHGLVVATLILASVALLLLAWVIASRASPRVGPLLYAGLALSLAPFFQQRPALVSYIGTIAFAHLAERAWRDGRLPPWWTYPLVALWANLHGQWVIAPAVMVVALGLHWLRAPRAHLTHLLRGAGAVAALVLAGCLTPLGVQGVLLPFKFRSSTTHINEWAVTELWNPTAAPLLVVFGLILLAWARSKRPIPWDEVAYVLVWTTFALLAFRNIPISAVILAPVAAMRASASFPSPLLAPGRPERLLLLAAFWASAVGGSLALVQSVVSVDALDRAEPLKIAQQLKADGFSGRILNDYNTSGVLVAFGPAGIELAIDGRAERYGAEYVSRHSNVLALSGDDWEVDLDRLDPEAAVVSDDAAIRHLLVDDMGWAVAMRDGRFVLLMPPDDVGVADKSAEKRPASYLLDRHASPVVTLHASDS